MGSQWRCWSDDEIPELARFVLKRHEASAEFFARSRAQMFADAGDADDAARWRAVAREIDQLTHGNIVRLPRTSGAWHG